MKDKKQNTMLDYSLYKVKFFPYNLTHIVDYIYYDMPLLSLYQDNKKNNYIYYWCDINNEYNRWLVFFIKPSILNDFLSNKISLKNLIINTNKKIWMVDIDNNMNIVNVYLIDPKKINELYIPDYDSYFI